MIKEKIDRSKLMKEKWKNKDYRKNMSKSLTGRKIPDRGLAWRKKLSERKMGNNNPAKRADVKKKLAGTWFKSENVSGDKNNRWKGGISNSYYMRISRLSLRQQCVLCGSTNNLHVHHLNCNRKDNRLDNLIILCAKCHKRIHIGMKK